MADDKRCALKDSILQTTNPMDLGKVMRLTMLALIHDFIEILLGQNLVHSSNVHFTKFNCINICNK
ncbi:hypothetical protein T11_12901 [Trichinella zimbabwensis]|uniref:Uncharacterized protein n=1 Tax=Trichinella zimbabwensis TaxID=268475 RepID=A0A0V1HNA4_9BILA|nr:hypothetical protein T11_12901 [Trichinella zimbabwensis]